MGFLFYVYINLLLLPNDYLINLPFESSLIYDGEKSISCLQYLMLSKQTKCEDRERSGRVARHRDEEKGHK